MTDPHAPRIDRTETADGYTVRLRGNCKHTQRDGWQPADITVEYVGTPSMLPHNLFGARTIGIYDELDFACSRMNQAEGR